MGKGHQVFVALVASLGNLIMGMLNVWPSFTSSLYRSEVVYNTTNDVTNISNISSIESNSTAIDNVTDFIEIKNYTSQYLNEAMTEAEVALMGSLPSLGAMLGTALAGPLLNTLGRKKAAILIAMPGLLSWALVELASTANVVLAARFLGGVTGGGALFIAPTYISEIVEDDIRGTLASAPISLYCFGMFLSYILGWFSTYHIINWVNLNCSVLWVVLLFFVTESPTYLLRNKREQEAAEALAKYRGGTASSKHVQEELSRLKQSLIPECELVAVRTAEPDDKETDNEKQNELEVRAERANKHPITLLVTGGAPTRSFWVVMFTGCSQVLMGLVAVQVFANDLFAEAAPDLSSNFCSVLLAIVLLAGSLAASAVADKAGRRFLQMTSCASVTIFIFLLGYLLQSGVAPAWVSAVLVLAYCFSFMFGAGTVPYVLLAEVFSTEMQSIATLLFIETIWLLNFGIIFAFKPMLTALGLSAVFYMFGVVAAVNGVVSYFILPETKGLSNQQIQEVFAIGRR